MTRSLAVWVDSVEGAKAGLSASPEPHSDGVVTDVKDFLEVHFNHWKFKTKKYPFNIGKYEFSLKSEEVNYLDIGIKFKNISGDIIVYYPSVIDQKSCDLALVDKCCSSEKSISAIFNSNISKSDGNNYMDVTIKDKKDPDEVIRIIKSLSFTSGAEGDNVKLTPVGGSGDFEGTNIRIPSAFLNKICTDKYGYVRFRINLNDDAVNAISSEYKSKDRIWLTRTDSIEILDFRVNEVRNLPNIVASNIPEVPMISSVHLFAIRDAKTEKILTNESSYKRCRLLEQKPWDDYLENCGWQKKIDKKNGKFSMLIYHWKEGSSDNASTRVEKFSAFAKFSQAQTSYYRGLFYAVVIILLGACGSLMAEFFKWLYLFLFCGPQ